MFAVAGCPHQALLYLAGVRNISYEYWFTCINYYTYENSNPIFPVWGSDAWRTMLPGSYSFWYPTNPYTYRRWEWGSGWYHIIWM